jgi:hypothetical protein
MNQDFDLRHKLRGIVELQQNVVKDWTGRVARGLVPADLAQPHIRWATGRIETANKYLELFG